jgi:hypothetical protein
MVFDWSFGKDKFFEERAKNLVKTANIFATTSIETLMKAVPLINSYFKTQVLSADSWDFYLTIAAVGTAFITIADYVPKGKVENVCQKIGDELVRLHPKGYLALENFSSLLHNSCGAGIPFHNAVGNWLAINLLKKDQPSKEDIETFSIAGALIQQTFGGWFKKK